MPSEPRKSSLSVRLRGWSTAQLERVRRWAVNTRAKDLVLSDGVGQTVGAKNEAVSLAELERRGGDREPLLRLADDLRELMRPG